MTPAKTFFIAALCGVAVSALPFDVSTRGFDTTAYAKGGGNGNGGGNGGGGNGNGGNGGKGNSQGKSSGKSSTKKLAAKSTTKAKAKQQQVAAVAKEKNLNAKIGRLHSLNRNINAYINSKSPNFAAVQAFVMGAAEAGVALAALEDELEALNEKEASVGLSTEEAARQAALPGLIAEAQLGVDEAEGSAALQAALIEMSNKTIDVDEDGFVDDADVVSWAEGVLGVGSAVGKIDEMREVLEDAAEAEEAATETADPVVPVDP